MKRVIFIITIFLCIGCNKDVLMEDLTQKDIKFVEKYAKDNDLQLIIKEEYSQQEKDTILNQSIEKNTKIKPGDKLEITISLGELSKDVLKEKNVNELGRIPVMMYHGIHDLTNDDTEYTGGNVDKDGYQRTAEAFRQDLEFYYQNGYRMIRLTDYVDGKIDVELGYSPIVITFDDGLENNIKVIDVDESGEIVIDPNSAVGILEEFKTKYPDYSVTATFFINGGLFQQEKYNEKIIKWLVDNNYDIGNHTYSHPDITKIDNNKTEEEIGKIYKILEEMIPGQYVNIVALPFGSPYSNTHDNFNKIISGSYEGFNYTTKATLRVGWEADYSPFDNKFNPQFLKRIRAYDNNGADFDIEMNFKNLNNNRFISDGNNETITIKEIDVDRINNLNNLEILTY